MKQMRNEKEIQELKQELETLTGFIADFGTQEEFVNEDVGFSNDVTDAICWVLGETSTEDFRSDAYLNMANLKTIAKKIEERTGNKLEDYQ